MHDRAPVRCLVFSASVLAALASAPSRAHGESNGARVSPQAAATFQGRCTACHTYGKGVKVGPDLKGVTERRDRSWLVRFIHGSSSMIASGDPTAVALFSEFKRQRMPDWTDLSEQQIADILDYLAAGGPEIRPQDERSAETATAADVELGRQLFDGAARFAEGGPACSSCHSTRGSGWAKGGSLGPDLTSAYLRYQDKALTSFLRQPCLRWDAGIGGEHPEHPMTPRESFAVKAFLRASALPQATARASAAAPAGSGATYDAALTAARGAAGARGGAR